MHSSRHTGAERDGHISRDELLDRARTAFADVPDDQLSADLDAAIAELRRERQEGPPLGAAMTWDELQRAADAAFSDVPEDELDRDIEAALLAGKMERVRKGQRPPLSGC